MLQVKDRAEKHANQRLVELLVPTNKKTSTIKNPLEMFFGGANNQESENDNEVKN